MSQLTDALLTSYPLKSGLEVIPPGELYPPRMKLKKMPKKNLQEIINPLESVQGYHMATVQCNRRITADDWFQDVRHIEFKIAEDVQYVSDLRDQEHIFSFFFQVRSR